MTITRKGCDDVSRLCQCTVFFIKGVGYIRKVPPYRTARLQGYINNIQYHVFFLVSNLKLEGDGWRFFEHHILSETPWGNFYTFASFSRLTIRTYYVIQVNKLHCVVIGCQIYVYMPQDVALDNMFFRFFVELHSKPSSSSLLELCKKLIYSGKSGATVSTVACAAGIVRRIRWYLPDIFKTLGGLGIFRWEPFAPNQSAECVEVRRDRILLPLPVCPLWYYWPYSDQVLFLQQA